MTPCIWLGTTHPCNPPHHGLWVNLHLFTMCIYKHCFLPMLLVLVWNVLKCLALCLITIIATRFLHLYACLTCSSVRASSLHPLLAHHHLCYVDVYCVFLFFLLFLFFLIFVICYISLWLHFGLFMYIFSLSFVIQLFICCGYRSKEKWTWVY